MTQVAYSIWPRRLRLITWPCLTFDLGGHGACGWCGSSSSIRIPSLKFVGLTIRKIWRTMCISINGPGDPNLWPFDLETGTLVTRMVGNPHSEFGRARPSGSRVIRYVRDGRTDGRTDKSNAYCPFSYGRGHNKIKSANNEYLFLSIMSSIKSVIFKDNRWMFAILTALLIIGEKCDDRQVFRVFCMHFRQEGWSRLGRLTRRRWLGWGFWFTRIARTERKCRKIGTSRIGWDTGHSRCCQYEWFVCCMNYEVVDF